MKLEPYTPAMNATLLRRVTAIVALSAGCFLGTVSAAPQSNLAQIPAPTPQETEILSLLKVGKMSIDPQGFITIPLYNPTKYTLKSCAVRVVFRSDDIERYYLSKPAEIKPLTDGWFTIPTQLLNKSDRGMECEMLTLSYSESKGE